MLDGSTVRFHPLADLFPPMGDVEFTALAVDIKTHGLRMPIVKMGDVILMGVIVIGRAKRPALSPVMSTTPAPTRWPM
jgi:hypothetical protein